MQSHMDLADAVMKKPGVVGDWSVKDVLAHVTTWEEEALKALAGIMEGRRPHRYGGVDRFNAEQSLLWHDLTLNEVREQLSETHKRLLAFLKTVPEAHYAAETRFRHRLRLDTYAHYPEHTSSILSWRTERGV